MGKADEPRSADKSAAGKRFGKYEVVEHIGRRGGAMVYRAKQITMGRLVDLIILPPAAAARPSHLTRFRREVTASSKLRHDNLISAIDAGSVRGAQYIVMEHVGGETLEDALRGGRKFTYPEALAIARDVAAALVHVGEQGFVHRGVSPRTVQLTEGGHAKLGGFELTKEHQAGSSETWIDPDVGTAPYTAPDFVRGERGVDARADVYAFGCTLYHLLTGRPPFPGDNAAVVLERHVTETPPNPRDLVPTLPTEAVRFLDGCLRKQRDHRYADAASMAADLELLRKGKTVQSAGSGGVLWGLRSKMRGRIKRLRRRPR